MNNKLDSWRKKIDALDGKIINLLAKRLEIVKKIGRYKKEHQLSPLDKKRWDKILEENSNLAKSHNLSADFIKKLFDIIHLYSLKLQQKQ